MVQQALPHPRTTATKQIQGAGTRCIRSEGRRPCTADWTSRVSRSSDSLPVSLAIAFGIAV
jgi:hypothetical protein